METSAKLGVLLALMVFLLVSYLPYRRRIREEPTIIMKTDVRGSGAVLYLAAIAFLLDIASYVLAYEGDIPGTGSFLYFGAIYYSLQFSFVPSALDRSANLSTRSILVLCALSKLAGFVVLCQEANSDSTGAIVAGIYPVVHVILVDAIFYGFWLLPGPNSQRTTGLWNGN